MDIIDYVMINSAEQHYLTKEAVEQIHIKLTVMLIKKHLNSSQLLNNSEALLVAFSYSSTHMGQGHGTACYWIIEL